MSEEKKGHLKITIEVEVNESLMDLAKESISVMPEMIARWRKKEE